MANLPFIRKGIGPTLVLVHGYLGGAAQWAREIRRLSRDFDVIAPNLPGFGEACDLDGCVSIDDMASAVLYLLDVLGVREFRLLGHSMGGMIAQAMARKRPERVAQLILYGTGPLGLMPDRFEPLAVSRERLLEDGVAASIKRVGATWFILGQDAPGYPMLCKIGAQAGRTAALRALDAMAVWDGRDALASLSMPALVIWGDTDRSYRWPQVEHLWTRMPDASLAVLPRTSHAAHLEKPTLFLEVLRDFLMETVPAGRGRHLRKSAG